MGEIYGLLGFAVVAGVFGWFMTNPRALKRKNQKVIDEMNRIINEPPANHN